VAAVRQYTHTGRPLGSERFVADLEHSTLRALAPRRAGRPTKRVRDAKQDGFTFTTYHFPLSFDEIILACIRKEGIRSVTQPRAVPP